MLSTEGSVPQGAPRHAVPHLPRLSAAPAQLNLGKGDLTSVQRRASEGMEAGGKKNNCALNTVLVIGPL